MLENFVAARAVFGMSLSLHSVRVFRRRRAVHAPRLVVSVPQEKEPDLPGAQQKVDHGLRHQEPAGCTLAGTTIPKRVKAWLNAN